MHARRASVVLVAALLLAACGGETPHVASVPTGSTGATDSSCPSARDLRADLFTSAALGTRPSIDITDDARDRNSVTYHATDGSDRELTWGEFVAATREWVRNCRKGQVAADLPQVSPSPEPETRCRTPKEVRELLISRSDPGFYAVYFDAEAVETQGIAGGPGFEIYFYDDYGQRLGIWPERGIDGGYYTYGDGDVGANDNTTFTPKQFVRYSKWEARRCRREA